MAGWSVWTVAVVSYMACGHTAPAEWALPSYRGHCASRRLRLKQIVHSSWRSGPLRVVLTVVWVGLQGVLVCVRLCCRRRCTGWGHGAVLFRYRAQRRFHAPVVSRGKGDMRTSPAGNLAIRGTLLVHARRWCCAVVVSIMVPHALLGRVVRTSRLVILALGTS
jgi:hypothetical protein